MVSSVTTTWPIRFSTLIAVLIPGLDDGRFVFDNQLPNLVEFTRAEAVIPCQFNRSQPELAVLPIATNVDVHWLVAVESVEEEPVRPRNARNPRHLVRLYAR